MEKLAIALALFWALVGFVAGRGIEARSPLRVGTHVDYARQGAQQRLTLTVNDQLITCGVVTLGEETLTSCWRP
jgi:hypothetical protein